MYQMLLIMALVLSIGGAMYVSVSHGSAAKAYTSLAAKDTIDDSVEKSVRLAEEDSKDDSLVVAAFKSLIGVESEVKASPLLTRAITGTYACVVSSSTPNCSNPYVFVFKPNSAAVLKIEDINGMTTTTQVGIWELNKDGQIVVTLFTDGTKRFDDNRTFTLLRGRKAQLITVDYPKETYPDILTGIFKFVKKSTDTVN